MSAADCIYSISSEKYVCKLHCGDKSITLPIVTPSSESTILITVHDGRLYALKRASYNVTLYEIISSTCLVFVASTYDGGNGTKIVTRKQIFSGNLPIYVEPHLIACQHTFAGGAKLIVSVDWSSLTLISTSSIVGFNDASVTFLRYVSDVSCVDHHIAIYIDNYQRLKTTARIGAGFIILPSEIWYDGLPYMDIHDYQIAHIYVVNGVLHMCIKSHIICIDMVTGEITPTLDNNFSYMLTSVVYGPFIVVVASRDNGFITELKDVRTGDKYEVDRAVFKKDYGLRTLMIAPQLRIFSENAI